MSSDASVTDDGSRDGASRDGASRDGTDPPPVERATRLARLAKLLATTLAALVGVARALGWL